MILQRVHVSRWPSSYLSSEPSAPESPLLPLFSERAVATSYGASCEAVLEIGVESEVARWSRNRSWIKRYPPPTLRRRMRCAASSSKRAVHQGMAPLFQSKKRSTQCRHQASPPSRMATKSAPAAPVKSPEPGSQVSPLFIA